MRLTSLVLSLLIAIFIPFAGTAQKKRIKLFDGNNLDHWYVYIAGKGKNNDPDKVFTIHNKMIRISGEEYGCLTTNDEFEEYVLKARFKWGDKTWGERKDKARDCGILLHSVGADGAWGNTWLYSIEYQMIEGATGDYWVLGDDSKNYAISCNVKNAAHEGYVYEPGGRVVTIHKGRIDSRFKDPEWKDIKGFRGRKQIEKRHGKWNRIKIVVRDGQIWNYLNGKLVNHAFDVKPLKGKIQLQSEMAEVFFGKVRLRKL